MIFQFLKLILINILLGLYTLVPQSSLSVGFVGNPATFIPHEAQNDTEKVISSLVFRKLFKYQDGQLVGDLVKNWYMSDDKTLYTMELKDDLYWQDGDKITTDDVIYTLSLNQNIINEIEIEKLSDSKFSIKLLSPNAVLPTLLTFGIEPAHLKDQSKLEPIGSSSFRIARVVSENNKVNTVVLLSFQKEKMYNRIIFKFYDKEEDLKTAYKLKEVNTFLSNTEFAWDGLTSKPITYYGRYFALIFNTEKSKLEKQEVRSVLYKSLDVTDFLKKNYFINAKRATGPISSSEYTKEDFLKDSFDISAELTQTQKNNLQDLDVLLPNNQDGRQIEDFLRTQWGDRLGVAIKPEYADSKELLDKAEAGEFDVVFIGHEVTPDPDRYSFWHSTQTKSLNLSRLQDLRADKALEEGRLFFDTESRVTHYNIFQDVMETKVPAIFLYHPGQYLYMSQNKQIPIPARVYNPSDIFINL